VVDTDSGVTVAGGDVATSGGASIDASIKKDTAAPQSIDAIPVVKPTQELVVEDMIVTESPETVPTDIVLPTDSVFPTDSVLPTAPVPTAPIDTPTPALPDKIEVVTVPPVSVVAPAVVAMETTTTKDSEIPPSDDITTGERIPTVTDTIVPKETIVAPEIIKDDVIVKEEPLPPSVISEPPPVLPAEPAVPSLSRDVLESKSSTLPRFHLPLGRPSDVKSVDVEEVLGKVKSLFDTVESGQLTKQHMKQLVKVCT